MQPSATPKINRRPTYLALLILAFACAALINAGVAQATTKRVLGFSVHSSVAVETSVLVR